jgi:hypothetical protein
MRAVYHPAVQRDVSRILRHYDSINGQLGDKFWEELNSFIQRAAANPLLTSSAGHARFGRLGGIEKKMEITLPLEKMTIAEKLRVMETLWRDLTRDEEQLESPQWHGEVLRERATRVEQGKETFMDWETAKTQLRNRVK